MGWISMSISVKILKELESSDASKAEKELMLKILNIEDQGTYQYTAVYEKLINEYIGCLNNSDTADEE